MKRYYVYAIRCFDGTFYIGVTNDVDRRFWEHQNEVHPTAYTHGRGPLILEHVSEFDRIQEAIAFEKKFKAWSHRKKRAFIEAAYDAMRRYSRGPDRPPSRKSEHSPVIPSTSLTPGMNSARGAKSRDGYNPLMNATLIRAEMPRPDPGGQPQQPPQPAPGEPGVPENPVIDPPANPT